MTNRYQTWYHKYLISRYTFSIFICSLNIQCKVEPTPSNKVGFESVWPFKDFTNNCKLGIYNSFSIWTAPIKPSPFKISIKLNLSPSVYQFLKLRKVQMSGAIPLSFFLLRFFFGCKQTFGEKDKLIVVMYGKKGSIWLEKRTWILNYDS